MGRPSTFTDELFDSICERMANGETLLQVCRDDQMPDRATVLRWVANDDGKRRKYEAARRACVEFWSDQIVEIATDSKNDTIVDRKGRRGANHEWISRSRLRVETMFKLMRVIDPARYGDKLPEAIKAREIEAAEQQALAATTGVRRIERIILSSPEVDEHGNLRPNGTEHLKQRIRELEAQLAGKDTAPPKPPALLEYDPGLPKRLDQEIAGRMVRLIRDHVPSDGRSDPASVLDEVLSVCRDAIREHFGPSGEIIRAAE
jgi:hypothetical protein